MGYIRHHAIIVTGNIEDVERAHKRALEIFKKEQVTNILPPATNGYSTFLIGPDGSKQGWETSNQGDDNRDDFIRYLKISKYEFDWVVIQYGDDDDDYQTKIVNDSDAMNRELGY